MTPDERQRLERVEAALAALSTSDRYTFQKMLQLFDGRNIQFGRTTGTKIGTATDQKLAFFGKTPVIQQSAIAAPVGGATVDTEARTAINSIRTLLTTLGFTA